jgi:hypothetical protein
MFCSTRRNTSFTNAFFDYTYHYFLLKASFMPNSLALIIPMIREPYKSGNSALDPWQIFEFIELMRLYFSSEIAKFLYKKLI